MWSPSSLEGKPDNLLQAVHIFRMLGDQEPGEAVHRRQPCIAGRNAISTLHFQGGEEAAKPICIDVADIEDLDGSAGLGRCKSEEQYHRVAVASYRVGAHAAKRGKIFPEEARDASAQCRGLMLRHATASLTRSPNARSKRSLAITRSFGRKCR